MNPSKNIFLPVAALAVGSVMFALCGDEHNGHDHSGHTHEHENETLKSASSQESPPSNAVAMAEGKQTELGVELAEAPMRAFVESDGEVTALPKGSVFREDGRHYVLALSEGSIDSFEKWEVTLGTSDDFFVEAKTGVFPGDRIVVAGIDSIRRLEDAGAATETAITVTSSDETATKVESEADTRFPPLVQENASGFESRAMERVPRFHSGRAGVRDCEIIVIEEFYDPHFHEYSDFHHHHHGYHGW